VSLEELLRNSEDAILVRWLEDALAAYPGDSSEVFKREKDPFANPIGRSLREGTRGMFRALVDGKNAEVMRQHVSEIMRIRAVQQHSPSQAVGFMFSLKGAIRAELRGAVMQAEYSSALSELDNQIDRIALMAFDVYVQYREQVCELRIGEVKRQVSWIVDKMNSRVPDQELVQIDHP
jgi:hypothetical protein